jgi:hypothetical protein
MALQRHRQRRGGQCEPVLIGGDCQGQRHRTACLSYSAVHAGTRCRIGRGLRGTAALEPQRRVTNAADRYGGRDLSKGAWAIPGSSICAIISPPRVPSPRCPDPPECSQNISPASWSMPPAISMKSPPFAAGVTRVISAALASSCPTRRPMKIPASCGTVPSVRTMASLAAGKTRSGTALLKRHPRNNVSFIPGQHRGWLSAYELPRATGSATSGDRSA